MKTLIIGLALALSACTTDVDGRPPYGFFNSDLRDPAYMYRLSVGNVFWAVALSETIIAPVYFIGWDIMQPVGPKPDYKKAQ